MRLLALAALVLVFGAGRAEAQAMRPFSTYRQWHGETRLSARLNYAAGALKVLPGRPGELYRMDALYDRERYQPLSGFQAATTQVELGVESSGAGGLRASSRDGPRQTAAVTFSPRADLTLDATLGASDADIELGGLRLTELNLQAGASRAVVRFSSPNAARCRQASLRSGAAELTVLGLGNSRCERIVFEGGVGRVTLDFSGAWTESARAEVKMALGEVTLRLPREVGVRISPDRILASFDPQGLVRQGEQYVSPGYEQAPRHLDIELTTAVGGVGVEWTAVNGER